MIQRPFCNLCAAQHTGNFIDPLFVPQAREIAVGVIVAGLFAGQQVLVRAGGNLWLVRDTNDLAFFAEFFQQFAHNIGGSAANAYVHFVKYQGGNGGVLCGNNLNGQADTG